MVIFLYGADTFRSRRFRQELQEKFQRDVDPTAVSLAVIDGQTATVNDLAEKLGAGSLFVKKRLIVIENVFANKKDKIFGELGGYLGKLSEGQDDDNVIIFHDGDLGSKEKPLKAAQKKLFSFLAKQKFVQEFKTLTGPQLLSFIKKEASSYNNGVAAAAAAELAARAGGDLWLIAGSIKKLAFASPGKEITIEAVKGTVAGTYDENIFGLTDALGAKNKRLALRLLEEQYAAGLSDEYLLAMLVRQFRILLQIRSALDAKLPPDTLTARLKIHPFVARKGAAQARNFTAAALKAALNTLVAIDWHSKTGQGETRTELSLFIASL